MVMPSQSVSRGNMQDMTLVLDCTPSIGMPPPEKLSKAKERASSYIACFTWKPDQPRFTIIEVAVDQQEPIVLQH